MDFLFWVNLYFVPITVLQLSESKTQSKAQANTVAIEAGIGKKRGPNKNSTP